MTNNRTVTVARRPTVFVAGTFLLAGLCYYGQANTNPTEPPQKDAFTVFGCVTDAQGNPMHGVEVRVHSGMGTLMNTGHTTTDDKGNYRVMFGPRQLMPVSDAEPLGVGFQAATVRAKRPGYFIQDLGRAGGLAMTDQTNAVPKWATNFVAIVRPFAPYRLDFVLRPAAPVKGELLDPGGTLPTIRILNLKGKTLPPSQNVLDWTNLVAGGSFTFSGVPVGFEWWFEVEWREGEVWKSARAKPFSFRSPTEHRVALTLTAQGTLEMTESSQNGAPK